MPPNQYGPPARTGTSLVPVWYAGVVAGRARRIHLWVTGDDLERLREITRWHERRAVPMSRSAAVRWAIRVALATVKAEIAAERERASRVDTGREHKV